MNNPIKLCIEIDLLLFRDGLRHIDKSLHAGHITVAKAHDLKNKLAGIYAERITHQVVREVKGASPKDRYIVQFCEQGYFITDCGFREGQLHVARRYVRSVVDTLDEVAEGIVFDTSSNGVAYRYVQSDEPEVCAERINAVFGEREEG